MTSHDFDPKSVKGSLWNRWDPHVHTPGTALNDQFVGNAAWEIFLTTLESIDPPIRAIGITDYFSITRYKEVLVHKATGRLSGIGFIFPNVELRLTIETSKASPINLHLLFDPGPIDHIDEIERFLLALEFSFKDQVYRCTRTDLIRLGKAWQSGTIEDDTALSIGANQFKVQFEQLRTAWNKNPWMKAHGLVAVAGGEKDGTSGLRDEQGSFAAQRREIESFANIIFSANPKQVEFWKGAGVVSLEDLERDWKGPKPCLHGSDAHNSTHVGLPARDRRCWIKGDLTFESLRQTCIEPETRVRIGPEPVRGGLEGNTISSISITNAPWLSRSEITINPGLVAIIGARGSGKTALADLIASGGRATGQRSNKRSFVYRAQDHLTESEAILAWEGGQESRSRLVDQFGLDEPDYSLVQYLSQQFVEQLCSAEGLNDSLVAEIERVIFNAHPAGDKFGTASFQELLELRLESSRQKREQQQEALKKILDNLLEERIQKAGLPALIKDRDEKKRLLDKDKKDRSSLIAKGNEVRAARHEAIALAIDQKRQKLDTAKRTQQALKLLQNDVVHFRAHESHSLLSELMQEREEANLSFTEWNAFLLRYTGEVDTLVEQKLKAVEQVIVKIQGLPIVPDADPGEPDLAIPLIAADAILSDQSLSMLSLELERLGGQIGTDNANAKRFRELSDKITKAETALGKIEKQIVHINGADDRITEFLNARKQAYQGRFEALTEEENELNFLYAPIKKRLDEEAGSLSKLSFSVKRDVNLEKWAENGEALLDLRASGPFKGRGELLRQAKSDLLPVWEHQGASEASSALAAFLKKHEEGLRAHRPENTDKRDWAHSISNWLFNIDHITVGYGIQYDGVEIEQLSPGTRGIVLLLLYLAIDADDDRPLIIDQPEENLDPQSIFQELVGRFREAKMRRQIIIVTHNANLVVNTDADQVIVASCGQHRPGKLPAISYKSGGLEDLQIRESVCNILEGGERAFRERAKRLRVGI